MRINNTEILQKMGDEIKSKGLRGVCVEAGMFESKIYRFQQSPETMKLSSLNDMARHFGFRLEVNFVKVKNTEPVAA